ncbi:MAG TPA: Na+/H+ antiporter [Chthoniobacterales bacterium]|jgi:CPA1 family monovalent cation:H+ antiporter|nr:Na+/H+ antiporter [Chthoniobacterales bacterium]
MAGKTELILICLVAVALLAIVARRIRVPYPILLTLGGIVLALVPGLPAIQLEPQLVFNLFLPPLIYPAAVYTSWRDFKANLRSILPMAIVLVLLTMTATAFLLHALTGLPLAVGFVFGAIISPPDAVAALSVTQHLRVPRKIIVILEGESLVNDATSFISFRFAVAAVMTGSFSLGEASLRFLVVAAGGIVVGLAVGWLAAQLQKRLDDPPVQTMFSLLTPYVAYFSGEILHVSGILAVVIAGMYYGWRAPRVLSSRMRLQAVPVWEMVVFILNGVLFMLIGLQLPQVIHALAPGSAMEVAKLTALVLAALVLVRFVWMFGATYLPRLLNPNFRRRSRAPWQHTALIAWTGLRGADSLAGALAIPFLLPSGEPFPGRNLILLLTFCVIFGTLVLQGLTIAPLTRWLGIVDDHVTEKEERLARLKANEAALAHVEAMESLNRARPKTIERLRLEYVDRIEQLRGESSHEKKIGRLFSRDFEEVAREALETERETVITLRNEEIINDQALRRIQRDIDLAEARLQRPA